MGTLLFSRGVPQRTSLDELVETRPGPDRRDPPRVHRGRRGRDRDELIRRKPTAPAPSLAGRQRAPPEPARRHSSRARHATSPAAATCSFSAASARSRRRSTVRSGPTDAEIREAFREQIEGLLEGGADVLLFETFSDLDELLIGVDEARCAERPADRRPDDVRRGARRDGRLEPADRGDGAGHGRSRRGGRQLRRRAADLPRRARPDGQAVAPALRARSCPTPACRSASRASSCTPRRPAYFGQEVEPLPRCRRAHHRRLLRHDARAHPAHARGARQR